MEEINYDIMRYDLDDEGYIFQVYFGCSSGSCIGYSGSVPDGYDNLEEWYESNYSTINAWKIVEGNLFYDSVRASRLEKQYNQEEYENAHVTNKELYKYMAGATKQFANSYKLVESLQNKMPKLDNSNTFPIEKITINPNELISGYLDLVVTNKNLLINEALNQTINGLTFEVNEDRSITINGTAETDTEYNVCGTGTNTSAFFVFKRDVNYYLSSNDYQIKMYNFDGTDRTLIYSGNGGIISFTDDNKLVTQTVLTIPSGTELNNITIYPQLELGNAATEYISSESKSYSIDLNSNTFYKNGLYASEDTIIGETTIIQDGSLDTIIIDDGRTTLYKENNSYELGEISVSAFDYLSYIFTLQDTALKASYRTKTLNCDIEGNVYNVDGIELVGSQKGVLTNFQFQSGNGYSFVGHEFNSTPQHGDYYERTKLTLCVDIPENLTILSAVITLKHNNVWGNKDGTNFYGYSRNLKLYKGDDYSSVRKYLDTGLYYVDESADYIEIEGAFGVNGYTPPIPTDLDTHGTTVYSMDIKDDLTIGNNTLVIRSGDELESTITELEAAKQTGWCYAYINVIGYLNFNNSEEE